MSEATAEYERCLEIEPDAVLAHWSLAYHAKSDPPGVRIARIEKARLSFAHDAPEQAYLRYALFKEFDDAGNSDMAWQHLQAGSDIKRASTPFDSRIEGQGFAAMQALADEDFIHGHAQSIVRGRGQDTVPIFIVGMPRTGTTLLERIVGNHAQVRAMGELNDFNSALCIESNKFLGTALTPGLVDQLRDLDYSSIGNTYLHRIHGKAGGCGFLVDKNPGNFSYAALIGKALPHARILCLKRSPIDACLSNYKELFSGTAYGYSYDLGDLAEHYIRFAKLCDHWEGLMPQQFHVVEYEALVADTEDTARRIMEFCGIPFEPDSVDITRNTTAVSTASSSQVRQPINTRGIGAWRRYAPYLGPLHTRLESAFGPIR